MKRFIIEIGLRVLTALIFVVAAPIMAWWCLASAVGALFQGQKAVDEFYETFRLYFEKAGAK